MLKVSLKDISDSKEIHSLINCSEKPYYPEFNYISLEQLNKYKFKKSNYIYVSFNNKNFSNFLYNNGKYYHYIASCKDIDSNTKTQICTENIIVQCINQNSLIPNNSNIVNGVGFLFSGGKIIDIKWNRDSTNPIKITDMNGKSINLIHGNLWWIILTNNSSIKYEE